MGSPGGGSFPFLVVIAIVVLYILSSIKILSEYERAVVFRLGRLVHAPKGPGITLMYTGIDRMVRISLRTIVHDVPPQDVITRDNVSLKVNAVIYYRVIDPRRPWWRWNNITMPPPSWPRPRCARSWGKWSWTTC